MSKVHVCFAQISAPGKYDSDGQVCEGRYTISDDGVVTLTDYDGKPVRDKQGRTYERKPGANETPHQVAQRLTRHFRNVLLGKDPDSAPARSPISYPQSWDHPA